MSMDQKPCQHCSTLSLTVQEKKGQKKVFTQRTIVSTPKTLGFHFYSLYGKIQPWIQKGETASLRYEHMLTGIFVSRPNRFIAHVLISKEGYGEAEVICHVKNTGAAGSYLSPVLRCWCSFIRRPRLLEEKQNTL